MAGLRALDGHALAVDCPQMPSFSKISAIPEPNRNRRARSSRPLRLSGDPRRRKRSLSQRLGELSAPDELQSRPAGDWDEESTWLFAGLSLAAVVGIPVWLFGFSARAELLADDRFGAHPGGNARESLRPHRPARLPRRAGLRLPPSATSCCSRSARSIGRCSTLPTCFS